MSKITKTKSGGWHQRVYLNGNTYSVTAQTKAECERKAAELRANGKKPKSKKTVRDCVAEYIEISRPVLKPKTINGYEITLNHGFPHLMDATIDSLDDKTVQQAINIESKRIVERTGKVVSPKTVRNEWGCISAALKIVAKKEFIVRLPGVKKEINHLPEPEQIMAAFRGTDIELPVMLAMWCGLRASEIYGLTYESIKDDKLVINKTRVTVGGERILQQSAKTDTSIREVNLPPYIKSLIPPCRGKKSDFIINYSHSQVYQRYRTICRHNGLDISFHRLRHEFASISLTRLMLPSKEVQAAGGWKTDYVMNKIYSETFSETRKEADQKRNEYLSSLLKTENQTENVTEKH